MKNKYRCSCCNKLKAPQNIRYMIWDAAVKKSESQVVGICQKCQSKIFQAGHKAVKQYGDFVMKCSLETIRERRAAKHVEHCKRLFGEKYYNFWLGQL